ncbi:M23 family metallopeptidase [Sutcliffiella horikoshii]|uniref:M23 family metallopeptidase n=1 Tax=Sutcliffiella horikoshii TaxID=79883 RepID=UPI0007D04CE2|nr:M23 family metallopeptidase [Sutcliffiella horikoshii]MCM3619302.1 M23 family metallopeptidase [Sutcliffiella horikoshii]
MNDRIAEIRRRAAKRRKQRHNQLPKRKIIGSSNIMRDEERYGGSSFTSFEGGPDGKGDHPLFNKELFLFKILASAILVLVVAIMFQNPSGAFEKPRQLVTNTMEQSFQFAAFSSWYEDKFGKSLALLPLPNNAADPPMNSEDFVIPASGRVFESFEVNGQGVMVETMAHSNVEAMNGGFVSFVGNKDDTGKTVIIQHSDNSYTWYGQLGEVEVKLYDFIETGDVLGKTTVLEDGSKGMFYFAIQKDNEFIDPMQVISFE